MKTGYIDSNFISNLRCFYKNTFDVICLQVNVYIEPCLPQLDKVYVIVYKNVKKDAQNT